MCLHGQEINANFKFKSSECFGCTSKLKNCSLLAQCLCCKDASEIANQLYNESKLWYWPLWVERFKSVAPTTTPNDPVGRGQVCRDAFLNTIKCGIAPLCIAKSCTSRGVSGACSKTPDALTHRMRAAFACVTLRFRSSKVQNSDVAPWLKGLPCIRTLEQGCMSVLSLSAHPRGSQSGSLEDAETV